MFKVNKDEKQLVKAVVQLLNIASENLEFNEEVFISSNQMLSEPFITNKISIEIKDDFKHVINQYGAHAGSVLILNRLFDALYQFLKYNYDQEMLDEQFEQVKEEIVSYFIDKESVTRYLEYCLLQDNLINLSDKEIKNIKIAITFGGSKESLNHRFHLTPIVNNIESVVARLKQLPQSNMKNAKTYSQYENIRLSKLTKCLADTSEFNPNGHFYSDIQFKRKDIQISYYATMKSYISSTSSIKMPTKEDLYKDINNLMKNVAKEQDNDFTKAFYTFNDTLLIITNCMVNRLLPSNTYWQLLNHNKKLLSKYENSKASLNHTLSETFIDTLLTSNNSKEILNEDFSKVVELLSNVIPKHLIILINSDTYSLEELLDEDFLDNYNHNLIFHFKKRSSYYPLHQVFKDFYIYYFKGFNDLRTLANYTRILIKEEMYNSYTRNKCFDIFEFNDYLHTKINNFNFKDIKSNSSKDNTSQSLSINQDKLFTSLKPIHSKSTFSLFDDVNFLNIYKSKLISSRK